MLTRFVSMLAAVLFASALQAQTSTTTPRDLIGVWALDCQNPDLRLASSALRYRGDGKVSPITQVVRRGSELDLHYERAADSVRVVDTLRFEGTPCG